MRQCGCAHGSVDGEQFPALSQGDGNVLFGSVRGQPFPKCCYLVLLSFSLNSVSEVVAWHKVYRWICLFSQ